MGDVLGSGSLNVATRAPALRNALIGSLTGFDGIVGDETGITARQWRETLAVHWCREVQDRLERSDQGFFSTEVLQLLAMVESALAFRGYPDPDEEGVEPEMAGAMLDGRGLSRRMLRLGAQFHPDWPAFLDRLWAENRAAEAPLLKLSAAKPTRQRPSNWPPLGPVPEQPTHSAEGITDDWIAAIDDAIAAATSWYEGWEIDGWIPAETELSPEDRRNLHQAVNQIAVTDRQLDVNYPGYSAEDWDRLMLRTGELRVLARGLALALSDDPEQRALVMSAHQVRVRARVLNHRIEGLSASEAWSSVRDERGPWPE